MVVMVTSEVQTYHIYIFLTTKRYKLKVRKFDGLSSSRSGDTEVNYRGHNPPPPILNRVKDVFLDILL